MQRRVRQKGIALVAVLAILTILAILAGGFVVYMNLESVTGRTTLASVQSDLLVNSALEHIQSQLRQDYYEQPAWDDETEPWSELFKGAGLEKAVQCNVTGIPGAKQSRWIYVHDDRDRLIGRYAVLIEDEAGKVNLNVATALDKDQQDEGVGPFEIMLSDGKTRGLPMSMAFARNILKYRYGRDAQPGQKDVDDNMTEASFAVDEIDNNANGITDEFDEGLDEQLEFNPRKPVWDDRSFATVTEAAKYCSPEKQLSPMSVRVLERYSTVFSRSREEYYDEEDGKLRKQVNINIGTKEQVRKLIRQANEQNRFEANSKSLRGLVANLLDYRDQNHVLSTVGGEYGVEAVCFNEIMANDGSLMLEGEGFNPEWATDNSIRIRFVHQFGKWYNAGGDDWRKGFSIESVSAPGGGGEVMMLGKRERVPQTARVRISKEMIRPWRGGGPGGVYDEFMTILKENGWVPDVFKNSWLKVYQGANANPQYIYYPILGNTKNYTLTVGCDNTKPYTYAKLKYAETNTVVDSSIKIDTLWRDYGTTVSAFPEQTDFFGYRTKIIDDVTPPDGLYYRVHLVINTWDGRFTYPNNYPYQDRQIGGSYVWKGYSRFFDLDGDPRVQSSQEIVTLKKEDLKGSTMQIPSDRDSVDMLRFAYMDGKAVQARGGFVPVLVTSDRNSGYVGGLGTTSDSKAHRIKNDIDMVQLMRPDIVELINISDRPISLRNWRVVINTGSYADQVGIIESAMGFNQRLRSQYDDPNPVIQPNGYFYLTNNREIFDREYGSSKEGDWGTEKDEEYQCFELPDELWGVRYQITKVGSRSISVSGAQWKNDQMKYEMVEFHSKENSEKVNGPTGLRAIVIENTANSMTFQNTFWNLASWGIKAGDDIIILGMPREGGFLSMTLKDQYGQITGRTIEYGSTEANEISWSTEKFDPTHYTWIKSEVPTFGGKEITARNHSLPVTTYNKAYVKDNPFASIGEIQKVRKASDWENIGLRRGMKGSTDELKSMARFFTVAGVRLDPEEPYSHIQGWKPAVGEVLGGKGGSIFTSGCDWEPGIWENQRLTVLSGALRGETFIITSSGENSLTVNGYSIPSGKSLQVSRGDKFSVGPAYATAFYYTRKEGEEGIWEWKNKGLEPMRYGLYIFGLNDSIDTTEFLEENYNTDLEVSVYNYETRMFDRMPLETGSIKGTGVTDPYDIIGAVQRFQYDKQDGIYCGQITPAHISPEGGVKLQLVPLNMQHEKNSGFAWFDYAYLAPGAVSGKININTAGERVLTALNGVTPELARNIYQGVDNTGKARLKPYHNVSDILDVRGISSAHFGKICNCITVRSDQFSVRIVAETLEDRNNNGAFEPGEGDTVTAHSSCNAILDRSDLTDDNPATALFRLVRQ